MFNRIINRLGLVLLFLGVLLADSENLLVPFAVIVLAAVMITAKKEGEGNDE